MCLPLVLDPPPSNITESINLNQGPLLIVQISSLDIQDTLLHCGRLLARVFGRLLRGATFYAEASLRILLINL